MQNKKKPRENQKKLENKKHIFQRSWGGGGSTKSLRILVLLFFLFFFEVSYISPWGPPQEVSEY